MKSPQAAGHQTHVLIVDDDAQVRSLLREVYALAGWRVTEASDGAEALRLLHDAPPNVIILDISMRGLDGWETLARIRAISNVPVVILSGRDAESAKVRALVSGAADYVTKPFGCDELIARTEALVRRAAPPEVRDSVYSDGTVTVDLQAQTATVDDSKLALTPLEFRLLVVFVRHPNQTLNWAQLYELGWERSGGAQASVKFQVNRLRRKLGTAGSLIETIPGEGYRFRPPR